jgi:hypothetical protein
MTFLFYIFISQSLSMKTDHVCLKFLVKQNERMNIAHYKYNNFFLFSNILFIISNKNNILLKYRYFLLGIK